jgi:hypothetical protein
MKQLPVEVWVLIVLIVEVLCVNWKLFSISSRHCPTTTEQSIATDCVWKQAQKIPCEPVEVNELKQVISQPASYVYVTTQQGKPSSNLAGVAVRIARGVARRAHHPSDKMCKLSFQPNHKKTSSFQWTMVRDPTQQAIDHFFRESVSHQKVNPNDDAFQQHVISQYQPTWLQLQGGMPKTAVQKIMKNFNFVGVMERMEESLVVLKLLLDLELTDILYLDNSSPFELYDDNKCVYQVRHYVSPGMKAFFESQEWQGRIAGDAMLYQATNKSLDLTIEALGRTQVEKEVADYRRALQLAQSECRTAIFPCTSSGKRRYSQHFCHMDSIGCGYACLDKVSLEAT